MFGQVVGEDWICEMVAVFARVDGRFGDETAEGRVDRRRLLVSRYGSGSSGASLYQIYSDLNIANLNRLRRAKAP